jgi:pumilio family protein 6
MQTPLTFSLVRSPSIRQSLIRQISPDIPQLLFHTHACPVIADFFELYATPKEKRMLVRSFYPKEVIVFESVANSGDAEGKVQDVPTLEQVLAGMSEGKGRERILDELAEKITHV